MKRRPVRPKAQPDRVNGDHAANQRVAEPAADALVAPYEPLARVKAGGPLISPLRDVSALQRSMGNRAVQRLLDPATRKTWQHSAPDEFEQGAEANGHAGAAVESHEQAHTAAAHRRGAAFGNPGQVRRRFDRHVEANRSLWGKRLAQRHWLEGEEKVQALHDPAGRRFIARSIDSVTLAPSEGPADGTTTSQASATTSGGSAVSKWDITGNAHGTTVNNAGVVTPGADTGGADSVPIGVQATDEAKGESKTGNLTLWEKKLWQAKIDFPKFTSTTHTTENFTKGFNGKFDMTYDPNAKTATATMKLKFDWPEERIPEPSMWNLWGLLNKAAALKQENYQKNFIAQVMKQWSGRYEFNNVREPQSIWGKLNPVAVVVNIVPVQSDQHFTVEVRDRAASAAKGEGTMVSGGVLTLYQGDDVPQPAFNPGTAAGELARVTRVTPTPIAFAVNSDLIDPADLTKLNTMGTYISRINNPKFKVEVDGYASKTGDSAKNQALSQKRADAVAGMLNAAGATNHTIIATGKGDGASGVTPDWQKVVITTTTPPGWANMQDVTAHEFGHMIGLGDEYAKAGSPKATHYDLVAKAFGPDYAEQVAKRGDTDWASIMDGGDDVRIQHYVTFWSALAETTLNKAAQPDPKFGYDDWKFVGT